MRSERLAGMAAVLAAALLWSTTGTAATFAPEVGAAAIGAAAMGIGGLLQAARAAPAIRRALPRLRADRRLLPAALAVAIYPLAFYASMRLAGVAIGTAVTIGTAPLFAAFVEMRVERTRLRPVWAVGAAAGLGGLLLMGWGGAGDGVPAGLALGLLAGLTYALYSWWARRMMQDGTEGRAVMGAVFGLGGLLLMPVLLLTGAPLLASWGNFAVGAWMALGPMFLGYVLFGYGLARIRASEATAITLAEPVLAALLAVALVGERLPGTAWAGIALVIASLGCLTWPPRAAPPAPDLPNP